MSKRLLDDAFPNWRESNEADFRRIAGLGHLEERHQDVMGSRIENEQADAPESGREASSNRNSRSFFTAIQACETCRKKKTRCDETLPCSVCRSLGVQCYYKERNVTKKEASLAMVMKMLARLEKKIDNVTPSLSMTSPAAENRAKRTPNNPQSPTPTPREYPSGPQTQRRASDYLNVDTTLIEQISHDVNHERRSTLTRIPLSFSQHAALFWPAIQNVIPDPLRVATQDLGVDYAVDLEMNRPVLSMYVSPYPATAGPSWLTQLPLSLISGLSEAFFSTFNTTTPIMDRDAFFSVTLGVIFRQGFGYDTESCLVLGVLALGCLALKTHEEGGFPLSVSQSQDQDSHAEGAQISGHFAPPDWIGIIREKHPGLRFLNEARRRAGALMTGNDIPTCQFYLLLALYYSQIIRPTDSWAMINKACVCCLTLLKSESEVRRQDWEGDVLCRLFWTSLMLESIWIQELNLPPSGLGEFESVVPIPKFTPYHGANQSRQSNLQKTDTFFQFHFLAQVAHRIILTRIRNTLYFYSETTTWPPPSLTQELHHQLDQWKRGLPKLIQITDPPHIINGPHISPAHVFATAMLHSRYKIAQFHISRPFLYKALHSPSLLTEFDLQACHDGLAAAMHWPQITDVRRTMPTGMPLKFAAGSQFFGQILMFYSIENSPDERVVRTLPSGYKNWCWDLMAFLRECAPLSRTVQKDVEILEALDW